METLVRRKRSGVPHSTRPEVRGVCHVVLRIRRGLPWLRTPRTYRVLERAFRASKEKESFALASGPWYDGWHENDKVRRPLRRSPVARSSDWILTMPSYRSFSVSFVPGQHLL